jgi:hypothetical protein
MLASKNLAKYSGPVQTHECPAGRMFSTNRTLDAVLFAAEEGAPWSRTVLPWGDEVCWKRCPDMISGNGTEVGKRRVEAERVARPVRLYASWCSVGFPLSMQAPWSTPSFPGCPARNGDAAANMPPFKEINAGSCKWVSLGIVG